MTNMNKDNTNEYFSLAVIAIVLFSLFVYFSKPMITKFISKLDQEDKWKKERLMKYYKKDMEVLKPYHNRIVCDNPNFCYEIRTW